MSEPCAQLGTIARLEAGYGALAGIDERLRMLEISAARQTEILSSLSATMSRLSVRLEGEEKDRQSADAIALSERWQIRAKLYALAAVIGTVGGGAGAGLAKLLGL